VTSYPAAKGFFGNREQDIFLVAIGSGYINSPVGTAAYTLDVGYPPLAGWLS
jgi:hypothetical protein